MSINSGGLPNYRQSYHKGFKGISAFELAIYPLPCAYINIPTAIMAVIANNEIRTTTVMKMILLIPKYFFRGRLFYEKNKM